MAASGDAPRKGCLGDIHNPDLLTTISEFSLSFFCLYISNATDSCWLPHSIDVEIFCKVLPKIFITNASGLMVGRHLKISPKCEAVSLSHLR